MYVLVKISWFTWLGVNSGFDQWCVLREEDEKGVNYRGENAQPSPCVSAEDI